MKLLKIAFLGIMIVVAVTATAVAAGSGEAKFGYTFLDETGNLSVDRSTFNDYQGAALSLENFRYNFKNGTYIRANLRNITLNNRNLTADFGKPGFYSLKLFHNQFRRIYDFDGGHATRRHVEGGSLSFYPVRYIEIFGGGSRMGRSGSTIDLFHPEPVPSGVPVDYKQTFFNGGARINYRGIMLVGEYCGNQFRDKLVSSRDQDRKLGRLSATIPVPKYEWVVLQGGFRHFETKFKTSDFTISSNRGWGTAALALPKNFTVKYFFMLDRTSSDSDYTATDNIVHAAYAGYTYRQKAGVTVGYQHDLNDQYFKEYQGNSFYGSGWFKPMPLAELRAEYGNRKEDVKEGVRLIGNEDVNRLLISGKIRCKKGGSFAAKFESRIRKNDDIGSKVTMNRATVDLGMSEKCGTVSLGYSYSTGDYTNITQEFKFTDHMLYGDATTKEYRGVTLGAGATYYRSKRDLDVESFNVRFSGAYRFTDDLRLEAIYNAYNFDDFLVRDQYYTANIVEINLIKGISF